MQTILKLRSKAEASALRAFSANGFGDAPIGGTDPHQTSAADLYRKARANRSYQLAKTVAASLRGVADFARRVAADFQRWQRVRATYVALRELDARILHDLGFHRSELMSVAAEVAGNADFTRTRLSRAI